MDVRDIGEFGLIERLRRALPSTADERLTVGIGDDAAVWRDADGFTIATTDTMVEGVHFLPGKVAWRDVGWKALAANVSDIAAMGGRPTFALVTLCLPADTPVEHMDQLYAGIADCAEGYGVTIAGGDIVSAPRVVITVALCGEASRGGDGSPALLRRSHAKVGDVIAVTGPLGGPAGGLRALLEDAASRHPSLVESHMHPWPRVDAGELAVRAGIRCGMDISDGLAQDLGHICTASQVRAVLRLASVPVDDNLSIAYPDEALAMAVAGGEDYELILVGGREAIDLADQALARHLSMEAPQLHIVGEITNGSPGVRILDAEGREVDVRSRGWDHLRPGGRG